MKVSRSRHRTTIFTQLSLLLLSSLHHRFLPHMQGKHTALKQCPMTCTVKNVSPGLQYELYKEPRCDGGRRCSATDQPGLRQYSNSASNTLQCLYIHTEIALDNELASPVPNICGSARDVLSENPVFILQPGAPVVFFHILP